MMSETIKELRKNFLKLKTPFESKGLKVNHGKIKMMVSGRITKNGLIKRNVDPCWCLQLESKG